MRTDLDAYRRVHASRANLVIHLLAVPLFAASFPIALYFVAVGASSTAFLSGGLAVFAMLLQAAGHRLEPEPPAPFSGPLDFLRRWFTEQYLAFPRFLLSGGWWRAFRDSGTIRS